jgi:hypothetical protein
MPPVKWFSISHKNTPKVFVQLLGCSSVTGRSVILETPKNQALSSFVMICQINTPPR